VFSQALLLIIVSGAIGISLGLFITFEFLLFDPVISQSTLFSLLAWIIAVLGLICVSRPEGGQKKTVVDAISAD